MPATTRANAWPPLVASGNSAAWAAPKSRTRTNISYLHRCSLFITNLLARVVAPGGDEVLPESLKRPERSESHALDLPQQSMDLPQRALNQAPCAMEPQQRALDPPQHALDLAAAPAGPASGRARPTATKGVHRKFLIRGQLTTSNEVLRHVAAAGHHYRCGDAPLPLMQVWRARR
ncbi:MAG: hypothetical protein R2708_07950 [Vicinamibacterales bacterium]